MPNRSDNFNRADTSSAIGAASDGLGSWTAHSGTWGIISNRAYLVSGSGFSTATLESSLANVEVECTILDGGDRALCARLQDSNNYLICAVIPGAPGAIRLQRVVGGTFTTLASYTGTVASGDVIRFRLNGTALEGYQNGVLRASATESTFSGNTRHGLWSNGDVSARFDDFSITEIATAATITGSITFDNIDSTGTLGLNPSQLGASTLTLDNIAPTGTLGIAPGTVTTLPFSRNTGSRPTGLTGIAVAILSDDANMTRLAGATSLSQDGAGRIIYSGAGLPAFGTSVLVVTREPDGKLGLERYTVQ